MIRSVMNASKRRLKSMASFSIPTEFKRQQQKFNNFLVLDFEATCENNKKINPQEIIEFPVLKINAASLQEESMFHMYVKPKVNTQLTEFCMQLTGITQDMVDEEPYIEEVLQKFHEWMNTEGLLSPENRSVFVTCGDWDLNIMLPGQCEYFGLDHPPYFNQWTNIKQVFASVTGTYPKGITHMMEILQLKHKGRLHSGLDDCKNIATILRALVNRGAVIDVTKVRSSLPGVR